MSVRLGSSVSRCIGVATSRCVGIYGVTVLGASGYLSWFIGVSVYWCRGLVCVGVSVYLVNRLKMRSGRPTRSTA